MEPDAGKYQLEYDAFARFIRGQSFTVRQFVVLSLKSLLALLEGLLRYIPGGIGYKLRYYFYKPQLRHLGKHVLIDAGVHLSGVANISIGDYTWIDCYCRIDAYLGPVTIGRRIHIASFSIIASRAPITIEDFVGISASVKIYSNSEYPAAGKRMSGPMVPEEYKEFKSLPVVLKKDSFVGANTVVLPGSELGEGCVVGANSVVSSKLAPHTIYIGAPPRRIGARDPITVPDEY